MVCQPDKSFTFTLAVWADTASSTAQTPISTAAPSLPWRRWRRAWGRSCARPTLTSEPQWDPLCVFCMFGIVRLPNRQKVVAEHTLMQQHLKGTAQSCVTETQFPLTWVTCRAQYFIWRQLVSRMFACRASLLVWCKLNLLRDSLVTILRKLLLHTLKSR